jgi:hypothetical protein
VEKSTETLNKMTDEMTKFLFNMMGIIISVLLSGFTLSQYVGWFLVPLGFPPVGIMQAYGVLITLSFIKMYLSSAEISNTTDAQQPNKLVLFFVIVLFNLLYLALGFIVQLFV